MQTSYELLGTFNEDATQILFQHTNLYSPVFKEFWGDKELHITVRVASKKRSLQQNAYFHGVIVPIVKDFLKGATGTLYDTEQTKLFIYHELVGMEFRETEIAGKTYYELVGKRMSQRNTIEFNEAKELIQAKMGAMDIDIPDPTSKYSLLFK